MSDLFADRLGNITVASGVVRLDFLRLTSLDTENQKAELNQAFRLVMPIDGMLQSLELLEQMKATILEQLKARQEEINLSSSTSVN
ncbi:hypothetical protein A1D22_08490 [Pasteurellaceae bacterium LFhippo2]|nr:hypothetical protein [Pasteurellaceae bacterium LFhippo2]